MLAPAPSRTAVTIAALVVLFALIALVAVNTVVTARVEALTKESERLIDPIRRDLNTVNRQLSLEMAALTRHAATGDPSHVRDFRTAATEQDAALRALERDAEALGTAFVGRYRDLEDAIARWEKTLERSLALERTTGFSVEEAMRYQEPYPAVIDAVLRFEEEITRFQSERRRRVQVLTRFAVWTSAILVLVAVIAGWTVLRLGRQLRASATALQRESDERMAALERERKIRETAEALVRSRDEILGVVSHDLRTPLTAIALSARMIDGASDEERTEHLGTIQTSARRMERLIQDLIDVTKIENSSLTIRHEPVQPEAVAEEVVATHRPIAAEKKIEFVSNIARPLPAVTGDQDRLVQALTNLVANALKFTPEGGTVRVDVRPRDGAVRFSVSDTGPGIAESDLPRLFDPFFQSKKTAHLGAGLGLKIARAIAEAHGGTIRVTNQSPSGACFTIDLPAARS